MKKISIIGAGNIGGSIAYALSLKDVCTDIALVDIAKDVANGKALDISQANCVFSSDICVKGGDNFELISDSDIVIITAGSTRKEGESRDDLLFKNMKVVSSCAQNIKKYAPNSIIIVITNPLDVMVYVAFLKSGFEKNRILGMAGELDSARAVYEISKLKSLKSSEVRAKVVGSHNDNMIISKNNINVNLSDDEFYSIKNEVSHGGASIVKFLKTSAFYAPSAAAVKMCQAIIKDTCEVLSASVIVDEDLTSGRLIKLGKNGIVEILNPTLNQSDELSLKNSELETFKNIQLVKKELDGNL